MPSGAFGDRLEVLGDVAAFVGAERGAGRAPVLVGWQVAGCCRGYRESSPPIGQAVMVVSGRAEDPGPERMAAGVSLAVRGGEGVTEDVVGFEGLRQRASRAEVAPRLAEPAAQGEELAGGYGDPRAAPLSQPWMVAALTRRSVASCCWVRPADSRTT